MKAHNHGSTEDKLTYSPENRRRGKNWVMLRVHLCCSRPVHQARQIIVLHIIDETTPYILKYLLSVLKSVRHFYRGKQEVS